MVAEAEKEEEESSYLLCHLVLLLLDVRHNCWVVGLTVKDDVESLRSSECG
jgi:hypothetical protein